MTIQAHQTPGKLRDQIDLHASFQVGYEIGRDHPASRLEGFDALRLEMALDQSPVCRVPRRSHAGRNRQMAGDHAAIRRATIVARNQYGESEMPLSDEDSAPEIVTSYEWAKRLTLAGCDIKVFWGRGVAPESPARDYFPFRDADCAVNGQSVVRYDKLEAAIRFPDGIRGNFRKLQRLRPLRALSPTRP